MNAFNALFPQMLKNILKKRKKVLTKEEVCAIMTKPSREWQAQSQSESRDEKSFLKTFQKGIDKVKMMCYNNQARCESGGKTVLEN